VERNIDTFPKSPPDAPITLRRTVRVGICTAPVVSDESSRARRSNGLAGIPPSDGWTAHHEVDVACSGAADATTGYLLGIQEIDAAVREAAVPILRDALVRGTPAPHRAPDLLARAVSGALPTGTRVTGVAWRPGPFVTYAWSHRMPEHAVLSERFEFSAAHRLHCPQLSDEDNRRTFGKCNHPSGHGHNYRVEVSVLVPTGPAAPTMTAAALEGIVMREVVDRFDHRHLNVDCPEFRDLNPSVENIARVCHSLLDGPVRTGGARLHRVTVWETEKTSASYPAE
jgi:6-pyruvoyltetrahydropterin/6-carboxytetrahydropterin synthase